MEIKINDGFVVLPLEEYLRLKEIERDAHEMWEEKIRKVEMELLNVGMRKLSTSMLLNLVQLLKKSRIKCLTLRQTFIKTCTDTLIIKRL